MQRDITQLLERMKYAIWSNMDELEIIILSEVSQTEKEKYVWHYLYVES